MSTAMRNTRLWFKARGWNLVLGAGALLLAAGLAWRYWPAVWGPGEGGLSVAGGPTALPRPVAGETPLAVKPPPTPADGFVGSEVCARCHAAIAETYQSHPMYRSAGRVPGEHEVEDFDKGQTGFKPRGNRRYWVEHTETEV